MGNFHLGDAEEVGAQAGLAGGVYYGVGGVFAIQTIAEEVTDFDKKSDAYLLIRAYVPVRFSNLLKSQNSSTP